MSSLTVGAILHAAELVSDFSVETITSPSRLNGVVRVRQAICWIARNYGTASYPMIASAIGRKDHTTIIYATRQCANIMVRDVEYAAMVESIRIEAERIGPAWMIQRVAKDKPVALPPEPEPEPMKPSDKTVDAEFNFYMQERAKIIKRTKFKPDEAPLPYPRKAALNEDNVPLVEAVWRLGCAILEARAA